MASAFEGLWIVLIPYLFWGWKTGKDMKRKNKMFLKQRSDIPHSRTVTRRVTGPVLKDCMWCAFEKLEFPLTNMAMVYAYMIIYV